MLTHFTHSALQSKKGTSKREDDINVRSGCETQGSYPPLTFEVFWVVWVLEMLDFVPKLLRCVGQNAAKMRCDWVKFGL